MLVRKRNRMNIDHIVHTNRWKFGESLKLFSTNTLNLHVIYKNISHCYNFQWNIYNNKYHVKHFSEQNWRSNFKFSIKRFHSIFSTNLSTSKLNLSIKNYFLGYNFILLSNDSFLKEEENVMLGVTSRNETPG